MEMTDGQNSSTDNWDMDTESDADDNDSVFKNRLAEWASKFQISHSAIAHLLSILQVGHKNLPKDPITLLQTSNALAAVDLHDSVHADLQTIYVQINIDGLPLFKSSNVQFWPILGRIDNPIQGEPFIIGLFCGRSKSVHVEEYLRDFITEMQALENDNSNLRVSTTSFMSKYNVLYAMHQQQLLFKIKQIKGHSGHSMSIQQIFGCFSTDPLGLF